MRHRHRAVRTVGKGSAPIIARRPFLALFQTSLCDAHWVPDDMFWNRVSLPWQSRIERCLLTKRGIPTSGSHSYHRSLDRRIAWRGPTTVPTAIHERRRSAQEDERLSRATSASRSTTATLVCLLDDRLQRNGNKGAQWFHSHLVSLFVFAFFALFT